MFCRKCGKEIFDNSEYCEECRNASQSVTQMDNNTTAHKKCCPKCKSRNLQIVTNTEFSSQTKGGGYSTGKGCCGYILLGPLGLLCGGLGSKSKTTVTSKSTTAWTCLDCGNKFRDIADIEKDIESTFKMGKFGSIALLVLGAVMLVPAVSMGEFFSLVPSVIFIVGGIVNKYIANRRIAALYEEKSNIEKNGYTNE